jgi:signal transduction histidine kinase
VPGTKPAASKACVAGTARAAACWVGRGLVSVLVRPDPAPATRWRWRGQRLVVYALLGAVTLALGVVTLRHDVHHLHSAGAPGSAGGAGSASILIALAALVPLPLAARYPLLGWRIGWLMMLLAPLTADTRTWPGGAPWDTVQIPVLLVVACAAGMRHRRPLMWWIWALTVIPWWLWLLAWNASPDLTGNLVIAIAFTAATVAVDNLGSRRQTQQALADQAALTTQERARRAVLEERSRIAREMHDIVAHHMSLIAVRAETAPYRLSGLPEAVRDEFGSLSADARAALADMRRLLGVLRDDQPAGRAPQPQISDLPALIDASRQAGVQVELSLPTVPHQVPAGVGLCAYRIIQESLSNASRHAPGAAVTVSVDHDTSGIILRVANGPGVPARAAGDVHGPGHGLAGMRERVALLGGSLSAVAAPGGGFVVSAVVPLGEDS